MRFFLLGPRLFAGIRPGVSFGPEDFRSTTRSGASTIDPDHSFLYVVKNDSAGLIKIGRTSNPSARLAKLQNEITARLSFSYLCAPKSEVIAIERDVHAALAESRQNGEWFRVTPDVAVGAIHAAAYMRGQPVLDLTVEQAAQIVEVAARMPTKKSVWGGVAEGAVQLLLGAVLAVAILIAVFLALVRVI